MEELGSGRKVVPVVLRPGARLVPDSLGKGVPVADAH